MNKQQLIQILDEYQIQKIDQSSFMYDIKNMKVMVEGYWATDCISTFLNTQTHQITNKEYLIEILNKNIMTIILEDRDNNILKQVNRHFEIRIVGITQEYRNNILKDKNKEKINIQYTYIPSSKL